MAAPNYDCYKHFGAWEFNEPDKMNPDLLYKLNTARDLAGVPFVISHVRQYRPEDQGRPCGGHGHGDAVDIRAADSRTRKAIVTAAIQVGFRRIGVYDRHVHLDVGDARRDDCNPDVLWVGVSE